MSDNLITRKIDYWMHRLLDLGKRNKMINYRETKRTTMKLTTPCFSELYNRIVKDEEELTFKYALDRDNNVRIYSILTLLEELETPLSVFIGDIDTETAASERNSILKHMRSKSRLSIEEQGTNILYVSFGFIEWYNGNGSKASLVKSPLILVPVSLLLKSINSPFVLKRHDDDIVVNPTLAYLFESEYGITLPHFDSDDDDIDDYMQQIETLANEHGWRVIREASVGLISFQKITMYKDIANNIDKLVNHPLINAISGVKNTDNDIDFDITTPDAVSAKNIYQVLNSDSSQQEAIEYSKRGYSFVMQGPPGTGKSQTITNIISEALAMGKTVLFVSEKMAALQVVYRRLEETNLAEFCLPLHNYKANKVEVLKQIGANLELKPIKVKDSALAELDALQFERDALNSYVHELHTEIEPLQMSCYEVYSKLIALNDIPLLSFELENVETIDQTKLHSFIYNISIYSESIKKLNKNIINNPWKGLSVSVSGLEYKNNMYINLSNADVILDSLLALTGELESRYYLKTDYYQNDIIHRNLIVQKYSLMPDVPIEWFNDYDLNNLLFAASHFNSIKSEQKILIEEIEEAFDFNVTKIDTYKSNASLNELIDDLSSLNIIYNADEFVINNRQQSEKFCKLKESLLRYNAFLNTVNSTCGTYFDEKLASVIAITEFIKIVNQRNAILIRWFDKLCSYNMRLIGSAKDDILTYLQVKKPLIDEITKKFEDSVLNVDAVNIKKKIEYTLNDIKELNVIYAPNDFVCDYDNYSAKLNKLVIALQNYIQKLIEINSICHVDLAANIDSFQIVIDLDNIINCKIKILPIWFDDNTRQKCADLVENSKKIAEKIVQIKTSLTQEWESEAFNYDYAPVLLRYKTEYTNIFKYFKREYHKDKKSMLALNKKVGTKLNDTNFIKFLLTLKELDEAIKEFDSMSSDLNSVLGFMFIGVNTDWLSIEKGIYAVQKVKESLDGCINSDFINFVTKPILDNDIHSLNSAIQICKNELDNIYMFSEGIISKDVLNIDFNDLICHVNEILAKVDDLHNIVAPITDKCLGTLDYDSFMIYLEKIIEYSNNENHFASREMNFAPEFESLYTGVDTDWETIECGVSAVDSIKTLLGERITDRCKQFLSQPISDDDLNKLNIAAKVCVNEAKFSAEYLKILFVNDFADVKIDELCLLIDTILEKMDSLFGISNEILIKCKKHINYNSLVEYLNKITKYRDNQNYIDENNDKNKEMFQTMYCGINSDWEQIISCINYVIELKKTPISDSFVSNLIFNSEVKPDLYNKTVQISKLITDLQPSVSWLDNQFDNKNKFSQMYMSDVAKRVKACLSHIGIMELWIDYTVRRNECINIGLSSFIDSIEGRNEFTALEDIFLKRFYNIWLDYAFAFLASLNGFGRNIQDNRVNNFCNLDSKQLQIAQMRIREKLISEMPKGNHLLKANDEMSVLKRELSKRSRVMPLRKLFRTIPNILLKLKPCFMMSPLSVSYFLESDIYNFDLVIFDEASQIFPEDAIGAIFRGKQVIIAGDSKQLPPTNFFSSASGDLNDFDTNNEDDYEDIVSDSILDEAVNTLPNKTLLWHYRSRHESLIAFSNREIYQNKLITFPSSIDKKSDLGVEYVYVENGYYEGGGKNCNVAEAQKCVELIRKHIDKFPERTLGIIAFSEKQQVVIENAVNEFRINNPEYEEFFNEEKESPFFVKNLENVQGDERDTIIFSICYAKDINGRMYMRFGPLGNRGGERRLNVAVTRAKYNIKLVGSILPADIDLSRTNSEGIKMLRSYIEFAINGAPALNPVDKTMDSAIENDDFCDIVADFIIANGYKIKRNVGCSSYKIDIAIISPQNENKYIAGIECDGYSYIQAKSARDRDNLRHSVLSDMGWKMYRIWSSAWIKNSDIEKMALLDFIESAVYDMLGDSINDSDAYYDNIIDEVNEQNAEQFDNNNPYKLNYYAEANCQETNLDGCIDNNSRIAAHISYVVSIEQPIHLDLLYRRLTPAFGQEKVSDGIKDSINYVIHKVLNERILIDSDNFVWLLPKIDPVPRIPQKWHTPRPMEYISNEEAAAAILVICRHSYGLNVDDLMTECALLFGFERRGAKIKAKLETVINYLTENKKIEIIEEKVRLIGE